MNEYNELSDEERLAQAIVGVEIDRYVHRELTPYGASKIAERLLQVIPKLEVPETPAPKQSADQPAEPVSALEAKLTEWMASTNRGLPVEEQVYSLIRLLSSGLEAEWDAGYERAEADSDGTGFWSRRFRSNPHRGIK